MSVFWHEGVRYLSRHITDDGNTPDDFPPASIVMGRLHEALADARRYGEQPQAMRVPWEWLAVLIGTLRLRHEQGSDYTIMTAYGRIRLHGDERLLSSAVPVP